MTIDANLIGLQQSRGPLDLATALQGTQQAQAPGNQDELRKRLMLARILQGVGQQQPQQTPQLARPQIQLGQLLQAQAPGTLGGRTR
jgi:hypothetical protein